MDYQSWNRSPSRQDPATEITLVFADRRVRLLDRGLALIVGQFFLYVVGRKFPKQQLCPDFER
jgi:hypothetical protein